MSDTGTGMGGNQVGALKGFVDRIEVLEGEIADLNDDKSEVYKNSKNGGFNPKVLRKVVAERRAKNRNSSAYDEQADLFDTYMAALGAEDPAGASRARAAVAAAPSSQPAEATAADDPPPTTAAPRGGKKAAGKKAAGKKKAPPKKPADPLATSERVPATTETEAEPDPATPATSGPEPATTAPQDQAPEPSEPVAAEPPADDDDPLFDDDAPPADNAPPQPAQPTETSGFQSDDPLDIPPALDRRGEAA